MIITATNKEYWQAKKEIIAKVIIFTAIGLMVADTIYKNISGITYANQDQCVLYSFLPKWAFFIYENVVELFLIVLLGIFGGVLIEQHLKKVKRFFPKNQALAFIYASLLPICSCGVIPVVESMKSRVNLKTLVTFIIAAPLLNPYIIFMSITILGVKYAIYRILASFILATVTGILVEFSAKIFKLEFAGVYENCNTSCGAANNSPFQKTLAYFKKLLPYVLIAGGLTLLFEYIHPQKYLETLSFNKEPISTIVMMVVGIPIYVCNGADVLFLKPLLQFTDLSISAAMAFSLTSSAICISSIVMLIKFFGKKLTFFVILSIIAVISLIGIGMSFVW